MGLLDRLRRRPSEEEALVEAFLREAGDRWWLGASGLRSVPTGARIADLDPAACLPLVHTLLARLHALERKKDDQRVRYFTLAKLLRKLLMRRLPCAEEDLRALVGYLNATRVIYPSWHPLAGTIKQMEHHVRSRPLSGDLLADVTRLRDLVRRSSVRDDRPYADRLDRLLGATPPLALEPGDAWTDRALAALAQVAQEERDAWTAFLQHCRRATSSVPSGKWLRQAAELRPAGFRAAVLEWFPLAGEASYENETTLRGLVWSASLEEDAGLARALLALALSAYRRVPGIGPRAAKTGNACVHALGAMPGREGILQLALLRARVKGRKERRLLDKALHAGAERLGLTPAEIEEMAVPDFGLTEPGLGRRPVGDAVAEIRVTTGGAELSWVNAKGRRVKSVPAPVRRDHAEALAALKETVKDIRRMLPVQRDRLDRLMVERRSWPVGTWRPQYLDHPLVGVLARNLVWHSGGRAFLPVADGFLDASGARADPPGDEVGLWHPLDADLGEITAWREQLERLQVRQPFKQAHREVYLLTDAERETRVYSNRFAAHVLKQHQFKALCDARGWQYSLQGAWDAPQQTAVRELPEWGLRAEFWVDGLGEAAQDVTDVGVFLHVGTDQVRFYRIDDVHEAWSRAGRRIEPLPLEEIAPLAFSEVMRDVDLFVGVASVGNDPQWHDGGPQGTYRDYWQAYSFGELNMTAKTRKEVLARLVPKLAIADRCRLVDRFLVVQGELRSYKIHLGSGNILMDPGDRYLCIVPARSVERMGEKTFLPFEGDRTLSLIVSKALLLADDAHIEDPTILSQIRG